MMVKFHGGSRTGSGAADYLMDFRDHKGRARPGVQVLRGNPEFVGNVIDSLPFKHRFTSAVIAWAPDDKPTADQIDQVIDSFERHAWAGLEPDRYAWAAVRHDGHAGDSEDAEKGVHVHILAARVDLETGLSLNIAPPGWQKYFVSWCNVANTKYGWARPDDPARRLPVQLGHGAGPGAQAKLRITEDLHEGIRQGRIKDREGVVNALGQYGEIARTEKRYVSLTPHGGGRNLRLRGAIYEESFDGEAYLQHQADGRSSGERRDPRADLKMMSELSYELDKRANRHQDKYGPAASQPVMPPEPLINVPGSMVLHDELHHSLPGAVPGSRPTHTRTSTRGDKDDRNREYAHSGIAGDSSGAGRDQRTLREFDQAVGRFESAVAGFTEILIQFLAEITAIIKRRMDRVRRAQRREQSPGYPSPTRKI